MPTIATLGPTQTISERAAREYAGLRGNDFAVVLYPSFRKAFHAVEQECDLGVLPIENMVEGYVQPVLDLLLHSELSIVDEMVVPIEFSFVANCDKREEVDRIYAQFVAQGQCSEFLETMTGAEIVTTQSNGLSLANVKIGQPNEGAIVPRFTLDDNDFALKIENVNDYQNNRTRFIVIARDEAVYTEGTHYKTSLVVVEGMDRPGLLADVLGAFSRRNINMVSIMSRPTKESLGKYHFFIDIEGHDSASHIEDALAEIQKHNFVRSLGSYPRAQLS